MAHIFFHALRRSFGEVLARSKVVFWGKESCILVPNHKNSEQKCLLISSVLKKLKGVLARLMRGAPILKFSALPDLQLAVLVKADIKISFH